MAEGAATRGAIWVVTGPAGGGKSALCRLLAARGAELLDGDALGHEVLARPAIAAEVARLFGPAAAPGGRVDRRALGSLVFADPAAMRRLEALTHPPLAALMSGRLAAAAAPGRLAVLEAAVYFWLPPLGPVDLVVSVLAAPAERLRRLVAAGLEPEAARLRLQAQAARAVVWTRADVILHNDGTREELAAAAERLLLPRWPHRGPRPEGARKDGT